MKKIPVVVSCPIDTYSGYGARSRDFVKALINSQPDWDVKILSQRWGNTRFGYLQDHNEQDLANRIIPQLTEKPKVWFQITVPNEFQPVGEYNIGVTAGIETTVCDSSWTLGVNRMDLVLTSANHGKLVFENSTYEEKDQQGNITKTLKLEKPVEVLFEGVNTEVYKKVSSNKDIQIVKSLDSIKESFCFLIVGHWLQGDFGQDRKNIGGTIKTFIEAFRNKHTKPALVIKTQSANSSLTDQSNILGKLDQIRKTFGKGNLPNIYLLHGELTDSEINHLYNHPKIKAMVSLTRGEGFGRPLLEFTTTGKPIIASGWSGHTDFLNRDFNLLVGGELKTVHPSAVVKNMILEEGRWFEANTDDAIKAYRLVYKSYKQMLRNSQRQATVTKKHFTLTNMEDKLKEILTKYVPEFPREAKFKMPGMKKISLPKMQTL